MAKPKITDKPVVEQAEFDGITIWRKQGGSIEVSDTSFSSVKSALKNIAVNASIDIEEEWNTQYMGWYIIRELNGWKSSEHSTRTVKNQTPKTKNDGLIEVRHMLQLISQAREETSLYTSDKNAISTIFRTIPDRYSYNSILVKLTIIDSLYSTQMGRRYYGLDELARGLTTIHSGCSFDALFRELAAGTIAYDDSRLMIGETNLFEENYGIGKDGNDKGKAVSLISKYAYFETNGNFPIYDSIAREMYPKIWQYCGFPKDEKPSQVEISDIGRFIGAINRLRDKLDIQSLSYDDIDRLLWTTGKIMRGNLSLVLTMEEYMNLKDLNLLEEGSFDVGTADLNKLSFLKDKPLLEGFFILAKNLSCVE